MKKPFNPHDIPGLTMHFKAGVPSSENIGMEHVTFAPHIVKECIGLNRALSKKEAKSIEEYLVKKHRIKRC